MGGSHASIAAVALNRGYDRVVEYLPDDTGVTFCLNFANRGISIWLKANSLIVTSNRRTSSKTLKHEYRSGPALFGVKQSMRVQMVTRGLI